MMVSPPPGGGKQRRVKQALQAIVLPRKMVGTTTRVVGECLSRVSRSAPDTHTKVELSLDECRAEIHKWPALVQKCPALSRLAGAQL